MVKVARRVFRYVDGAVLQDVVGEVLLTSNPSSAELLHVRLVVRDVAVPRLLPQYPARPDTQRVVQPAVVSNNAGVDYLQPHHRAPPRDEQNKLIFMTSYLYPEYDYTYIMVTVARWSGSWNQGLALKTLGTIEVPMVECQTNEPKLEVVTKDEAGKLLGVEACGCRAARYTLTRTPRFFYDEYTAGLAQDDIPEGLKDIASLINGESEVSISLLHPVRRNVQDVTREFTYNILENCTQGWLREEASRGKFTMPSDAPSACLISAQSPRVRLSPATSSSQPGTHLITASSTRSEWLSATSRKRSIMVVTTRNLGIVKIQTQSPT